MAFSEKIRVGNFGAVAIERRNNTISSEPTQRDAYASQIARISVGRDHFVGALATDILTESLDDRESDNK
jgi:hypothetical protein